MSSVQMYNAALSVDDLQTLESQTLYVAPVHCTTVFRVSGLPIEARLRQDTVVQMVPTLPVYTSTASLTLTTTVTGHNWNGFNPAEP